MHPGSYNRFCMVLLLSFSLPERFLGFPVALFTHLLLFGRFRQSYLKSTVRRLQDVLLGHYLTRHSSRLKSTSLSMGLHILRHSVA
ncbi:hypothetical protein DFH07DRAFT_813402 [Mycena maculata]|uniref:Uncharacterized protein n=1 Tax=Mycena maculata TaxID=230809 RepID=A0AAD7NJE5_9AGAR|nr:hypothetical protein DFH07DRAFT_813402 [Mycena maculata]